MNWSADLIEYILITIGALIFLSLGLVMVKRSSSVIDWHGKITRAQAKLLGPTEDKHNQQGASSEDLLSGNGNTDQTNTLRDSQFQSRVAHGFIKFLGYVFIFTSIAYLIGIACKVL